MDAPSSRSQSPLGRSLAAALPSALPFTIYHISSPPQRCPSIFSAPLNSDPDITYSENHFLGLAIRPDTVAEVDGDSKTVFVFAMEVIIYTTSTLTTYFVSKVDSTGYLQLLKLLRGASSVLKNVTSTFLGFLIEHRQRPGVKQVISLFGRAQDQYLFPGSAENGKKHLLDDRGLIGWWCRTLSLVLKGHIRKSESSASELRDGVSSELPTTQGYVLVPGLDAHETMALLPPAARTEQFWVVGHPLRIISANPDAPPQCLIPRFPDDPKARYLDELDEELLEASQGDVQRTPSKRRGQWRSVRSLEQFWEAMEFRQECSSGRLVGFIWIVFDSPQRASNGTRQETNASQANQGDQDGIGSGPQEQAQATGLALPSQSTKIFSHRPRKSASTSPTPDSHPHRKTMKRSKQRPLRRRASTVLEMIRQQHLSGPIITRARQRRGSRIRNTAATGIPIETPYYYWSLAGRGQVVLEPKDYQRVHDFLLRLDFSNEECALTCTGRWVEEVGAAAGLAEMGSWGEGIVGTKSVEPDDGREAASAQLEPDGTAGVKRECNFQEAHSGGSSANMLGAGLVRKKPKVAAVN